MMLVESAREMRSAIDVVRADGRRIGFVPTMGFLHEGHIALIDRARATTDVVVASIFVNPTQFSPGEDLGTYPRDPDGDRSKLESAGCDFLFQPDSREIYPDGFSTFVFVDGVSRRYEGAARPTHFRGVATVVAKLFNIIGPHVAVFGQKDAQQIAVIRRMIVDLDLPVVLDVVATVRDDDGLARSSRNVYLSADERVRALSLSHALRSACDCVSRGGSLDDARSLMLDELGASVDVLDYADIVDPDSFEPAVAGGTGTMLAIAAARFGKTRLIDNMTILPTAADAGGMPVRG